MPYKFELRKQAMRRILLGNIFKKKKLVFEIDVIKKNCKYYMICLRIL